MVEDQREVSERKRLTDKADEPSEDQIRLFPGDEAWKRLQRFEELLSERYEPSRQLKFPFGNEYGWGFRYSHRKSLLLYVFFEEGAFCCTISINDAGATKVEAMLNELRPETQDLWANRYPCGQHGGWIHHSVLADSELPDLLRLVGAKKKPQRATPPLT